jgi:hypothetical protein
MWVDGHTYKIALRCGQIFALLWSDRPTGAVRSVCGQTDRLVDCGQTDRLVDCGQTVVRPTGAVRSHCGHTDRLVQCGHIYVSTLIPSSCLLV